MTQRSRRKTPEQDAIDHIILGRDKPFLEARFINTFKGRGVFTREYIALSTFVVEYRGILGASEDLDVKNNIFLFDFIWSGMHFCINASKEDGTLGRLANDNHRNPNCRVKKIVVKGTPHLCLFAVKEIFPEEELTYNYGDSAWPWRLKAPREVASNPEPERDPPLSPQTKMCHHELTSAVISSLDNCHDCRGPVSSLKWIGFTCKLCSTSWHKTCFIKNNESPMKDICLSSNEGSVSDKDYIPETASSSDGSSADEDCPPDSEANTDWDHLIATIRDSKPPHCKTAPTVSTKNYVEHQDTAATTSDKFQLHEDFIPDMASSSETIESVANPKDSSCTLKNYCYVCSKPQSKIARHFKKHEKEQPEIAEAFMFPKHSKERKRLLE
ncbi:uncharacterized protein LOC117485559 [Trematomus bernacchii]|uniref:uncharacterized protein LOC117485559 n=1 Tax=Trematomus bernacchii TaxID=40690 RepID=UPI00146A7562|nr:uncharacterized protein LOC117485559 [Trematomus bernacchii]